MTAAKKELVVRLPVDVYEAVKARADREERTVSQTVRLALRLYLRTPRTIVASAVETPAIPAEVGGRP